MRGPHGVGGGDQHQRAYVLVIETETGRTVRTEEVKGWILGQVLTTITPAVRPQSYYPGGIGTAPSLPDKLKGRAAATISPMARREPPRTPCCWYRPT